MRVRFLKDVVYETEGFQKGPRFEADSVHDLREDLAKRWINRGVAEQVAPPIRKAPREPSAPTAGEPSGPTLLPSGPSSPDGAPPPEPPPAA